MNPFIRNLSQQFNKSMVRLAGENYRNKKYLIALSGGGDSMALCHLAKSAGMEIIAAHCNFNLRGEESDQDENAVSDFCQQFSITAEFESFDTKKITTLKKQSTQVVARQLRYEWFEELAKVHHIDFILTGHHKDDNVETFFLNLSRGSGPKGLKGIPELQGKILRPLLTLDSIHLNTYCKILQLPFREDSSNKDNKYKRNFVRNEVLPLMSSQFPGLKENVENTMSILGKYHNYIDKKVKETLKDIVEDNSHGTRLYLQNVEDKDLIPFIVRDFLEIKGFSSSDIEDMIAALGINKSGIKILACNKIAFSERQKVVVINEMPKIAPMKIPLMEGSFDSDFGKIIISKNADSEASNSKLLLPLSVENVEMTVRTKVDGDRITSLGMNGQKQKLQDVFTNAKLDQLLKLLQPVFEIDGKIIWIPGIKRSQELLPKIGETSFVLEIK